MKNYSIKTLLVSLPEESITEAIIVTLPNNATPIGIVIRPTEAPEGLFLHYLVPVDEEGVPIEEVATNTYEIAWNKLSELFGERSEQDNIETMASVLNGVKTEIQDEVKRQSKE